MERILLFASVFIGVLVWLAASLLPPRSAAPPPPSSPSDTSDSVWRTPLGWTALALPFLGFILTLPTTGKVFSSGQDLGRGFLVGGIAALLAARSPLRDRDGGRPTFEGVAGLAAAAAGIAALFLRAGIIDALAGVAIGWFVTTFPLYLALRRAPAAGAALAAGAGFAAAVVGTAAAAIWRDSLTPSVPKTTWAAIALAFVACSAIVLLVCRTLLGKGATPSASEKLRLVPAGIFVALAAGTIKLLTLKIGAEPRLFWAAVCGLITALVATWLLAAARPRDGRASSHLSALPILLIVAGFIAAYQLLHGLGAGLFVLALWLTSYAARPEQSETAEPADIALLLFASVMLISRVVAERYAGEMRGVVLTDQYALFGLIVGAVTPGLLAAITGRRSALGVAGALTLVPAVTLAAGVPAVVVLLFGAKSALALLTGLALGALSGFRGDDGADSTGVASLLPGLYGLASSLALLQFTDILLPLTDMTRLRRVEMIGVLTVGVIIALAAAQAAARNRRGTGEAS